MKIEINEHTKMHAAIELAQKGKFYDALCLFAQVESYESALNRIACLCLSDNEPFAIDFYFITKQKYPDCALYSDLKNYYEWIVQPVLDFCERDRKYAIAGEGSRHADKSLLAIYGDDDLEDFPMPDLDYVKDEQLLYDPRYSPDKFYDVNSEEYLDFLRINMERLFSEGESREAQQYVKRILDIETDHLPTLETQISLCLYSEKYKLGVPFAERLAEVEGGSHAAVGGAIEILVRQNPKRHLPALKKLMEKARRLKVNSFDLEDYVYIASDILHSPQLAAEFAERLFKDRLITLEGYKICACAFWNVGDFDKAKDATITILRILPENEFARIMLEYINSEKDDEEAVRTPFKFTSRFLRHYYMPDKLAVFAQSRLVAELEALGGDMHLPDNCYQYLLVEVASCRSLMITNQRNDYFETSTYISIFLRSFPPQNLDKFVEFAGQALFSVMCDQSINEFIISCLLVYGYKGKLFVGMMTNRYYLLDFSQLDERDEMFCYAFAICASLREISDPAKYIVAYHNICEKVHPGDDEDGIYHKFAYAMLCLCVKGFNRRDEADYFPEVERDLYKRYKRALKEST